MPFPQNQPHGSGCSPGWVLGSAAGSDPIGSFADALPSPARRCLRSYKSPLGSVPHSKVMGFWGSGCPHSDAGGCHPAWQFPNPPPSAPLSSQGPEVHAGAAAEHLRRRAGRGAPQPHPGERPEGLRGLAEEIPRLDAAEALHGERDHSCPAWSPNPCRSPRAARCFRRNKAAAADVQPLDLF